MIPELNEREWDHVRAVLREAARRDRETATKIAQRRASPEELPGQKLAIRALLENAAESDRLGRLMAE